MSRRRTRRTSRRPPHPSLFRPAYRAWLYARAWCFGRGCAVCCCYCDAPLKLRTNAPGAPEDARAATLDHVLPSEPQDNGPGNVVAACWTCNASKGGRSPTQWAAEGGPPDAFERAARQTSRFPSSAALLCVRAIYDLQPGRGVWGRPEGRAGYGAGSDEFLF